MSAHHEEKIIDLWIGARWGFRSGAYGGAFAGIILALAAAALVLFTDFQLTGLEILSVFWVAGVYGFILGILGGALGGLIGGAIAGATHVPRNMPLAGATAGMLLGFALIASFFAIYVWLNRLPFAFGLLLDLAPAALVGAFGGAVGGFFAGRRFASYYERHPLPSAYDKRWNE